MIVLFTDFGHDGPYSGQMHLTLARLAPGVPVVELMSDAPAGEPRASAYLLAALAAQLPPNAVTLAVIDPGVGSDRAALLLDCDGRRYLGPDNGLLSLVGRHATNARWWRLREPDAGLSATFHGRDLFAPAAAKLALQQALPLDAIDAPSCDWPDELAEIIYTDHYGNLMTGLRADSIDPACSLLVNGHVLAHGRTFSDVPAGSAFWYRNSIGLLEVAVNRGRACDVLRASPGQAVSIQA